MSRKLLLWVILLPALCGFSFLGAYTASSLRHGGLGFFGAKGPVLDYPEVLELGEQEAGELVIWPFTIANRGDQELVIDEVQASCSCSGLVFADNADQGALSNLKVGMGTEVRLALRLSVPWQPGNAARYAVQFRTNEPESPLKRIVAEVSLIKGVITTPVALTLGSIPKGATIKRIVEVHDRGGQARSIESVSSTSPDRFQVHLITDDRKDRKAQIALSDCVIGRIEVTFNAQEIGPIEGNVQVQVSGRNRPASIPVFGEVVSDFQVTPSSLLLPKMSGRGPLYQADCLCRSRKNAPMTVSLAQADDGLKVELLPDQNEPDCRTVRITLDEKSLKSRMEFPKKIKLMARADDAEEPLEIRVYCRSEGMGDGKNRRAEEH